MKILTTAPYIPYPLHGGAPIRMYHVTKGLAKQGHDITLLAGLPPDAPDPASTPLEEITSRISTFPIDDRDFSTWIKAALSPRPYPASRFANKAYEGAVEKLLEEDSPDLVLANFLFMAAAPAQKSEVPVVLDQHEDELHHWRGYLSDGAPHERAFAALTIAKLSWFQPRVLSRVDAVAAVAVSEAEAIRERLDGQAPVWTIPNGVDVEDRAPLPDPPPGTQNIVFVAGMGVKRNADAARWFVEEVFPEVRAADPSARLILVGSDPLPEVRQLQKRDGVEVTGTVPDVAPYYQDANVVVVPQRFGAGTKLKVLEALALNRPLVTTTNGAQGIAIEDGEHALISDKPEEFASAVISLLQQPEKGAKLAMRGRALVEEEYSWREVVGDLDERLRDLTTEEDTTTSEGV